MTQTWFWAADCIKSSVGRQSPPGEVDRGKRIITHFWCSKFSDKKKPTSEEEDLEHLEQSSDLEEKPPSCSVHTCMHRCDFCWQASPKLASAPSGRRPPAAQAEAEFLVKLQNARR